MLKFHSLQKHGTFRFSEEFWNHFGFNMVPLARVGNTWVLVLYLCQISLFCKHTQTECLMQKIILYTTHLKCLILFICIVSKLFSIFLFSYIWIIYWHFSFWFVQLATEIAFCFADKKEQGKLDSIFFYNLTVFNQHACTWRYYLG